MVERNVILNGPPSWEDGELMHASSILKGKEMYRIDIPYGLVRIYHSSVANSIIAI